jgi:hypothetical protein
MNVEKCWLRKLFPQRNSTKEVSAAAPATATPVVARTATNAVATSTAAKDAPSSEKPLHAPLLQAMQAFRQGTVPAGTQLFHGSNVKSPYTDFANQSLQGTRKWLSQSAKYAVSYAFNSGDGLGAGLLWVCTLNFDVRFLAGSQSSLKAVSPWEGRFPWEFPNNFGRYAEAILGTSGPICLLDHEDDGQFKEVLIVSHRDALQIVNVIQLPADKSAAERYALSQYGC